jgi:phosphatidylethanolamine-binding protein (PEBP) family uncharacterized protein
MMKEALLVAAMAAVIVGGARSPQHGAPGAPGFVLHSPAIGPDAVLPVEYSGDGAGVTPPLEWSQAPAGTTSYALVLHHVDREGVMKCYWILHGIPGRVTSLAKGVADLGTMGLNNLNGRAEYAPPRSKGPGPKRYVFTVYALSAPPRFAAPEAPVDRDTLLAAIKDRTLGSAELTVTYSRAGEGGEPGGRAASRVESRDGAQPRPRTGDSPAGRASRPARAAAPAQRYSIAQAVSDEAQLHTIAFDALAFMTGDFGSGTFLPPGKVCDFFGFQYLRDIDRGGKGHNPIFLDRVAGNVFHAIGVGGRAAFEKAAREDASLWRTLAEKRLPLIKAFWRLRDADVPRGSSGLNRDSVAEHAGEIFALDAELSFRRARVYSRVAAEMGAEARGRLAGMTFGDFNTWPESDVETYKLPRGTDKLVNVLYMTYASEFFSWYAGSLEADTYFCPERHGTYFGSFFMKDMPAMGRDVDISTSVTGDSGQAFLDALTPVQRGLITSVLDDQRAALTKIVETRRTMAVELRKLLAGAPGDEGAVLALGRQYGRLDGEIAYRYATAFASVYSTLTPAQRQVMAGLRNLDGYRAAPAYLYSDPVNTVPALQGTDRFFSARQ